MLKSKQKPIVLKGSPVTQAEVAKAYKLSKKDIARLTALVESTPGVHDSNEEVIARYQSRAVFAAS